MENRQVTEADIRPLIDLFYDRVRGDPALGPIFGAAITDWDDHLERLTDFWSSVMLTSGRYKGNPVARHVRHVAALTPAAFERWLQLWSETTDEMLSPSAASAMQVKAARIAESLQLAVKYQHSSQGRLLPREVGTDENAGLQGSAPLGGETTLHDRKVVRREGRLREADIGAAARHSVIAGTPDEAQPRPYASSPTFTAETLPRALQHGHRTKPGVWALLRVFEGKIRYCTEAGGIARVVTPDSLLLIQPEELHHVELLGPVRLCLDFFDQDPSRGAPWTC